MFNKLKLMDTLQKIKKSNMLLYIGVLCIADFIFIISIGGGINLGTLFPGIVGILLIAWNLLNNYFEKYIFITKIKIIRKVMLFLFSLWLVSFFIIESLIFLSAIPASKEKVDYLIILGAGLNGEQLSLTLLQRMNKSLEYIKENPDIKIVVSGGQGFGEKITEAEAMERFLIRNGVDADRILKEVKATSTMENFKFSKELLKSLDKKEKHRIMIITSEFHLFRAKILARRNGFIPYGIPAKTPFYLLPNVCIREYFAVIKSLLFDW